MSDKVENWIEFPDGSRVEYNAIASISSSLLSAPQTLQLPPPSYSKRSWALPKLAPDAWEEAYLKLQPEHAALEIKLADANGRIASLEAELADLKPKPVPAPIAPIHAAIRAKPAFGGLRCIFE